MLRDLRGRTYASPSRPAADPIDGADVVLTLDAELQEIAERALSRAVHDAHASGGDVVILQPRTGEILAMTSVGVISDPYEPGSTAKIFTAAALLRTGKARPRDSVFGEHGTWVVPGRAPIHDTHAAPGMLTLADVIRVSSNIGSPRNSRSLTMRRKVWRPSAPSPARACAGSIEPGSGTCTALPSRRTSCST